MLDTARTTNNATAWNPSLGSSAEIIYLDAGDHVFVGGDFHNYGAVTRSNIAGVDLLTGELLAWNPGTNGWVHAMDVRQLVYIGGEFTTGRRRLAQPHRGDRRGDRRGLVVEPGAERTGEGPGRVRRRRSISSVSSRDARAGQPRPRRRRGHPAGAMLPWNPAADAIRSRRCSWTARASIVGGRFAALGGLPRGAARAPWTRPPGPASTTFTPTVNGVVYRVDVQNRLVFFGGEFDLVNGATRSNAAAVRSIDGDRRRTAQLVGWNPNVGGPVYDIDAFGASVYLAGGFGSVGGSSRPGIAMVDALATGGAVRSWSPSDVSGGQVSVIDTSDTAVLFGGLLNDLNGVSIGAVLYPEASLAGTPRPPTTPDVLVRGASLRLTWGGPPLGARPLAYVIEGGSAPGAERPGQLLDRQHRDDVQRRGPAAGHLLPAHALGQRRRRRRRLGRAGLRRRRHGLFEPAHAAARRRGGGGWIRM